MKRQLGTFETAQILTGERAPFNLVIVLRLINGPGFDVLQTALQWLHLHQPMLRAGVKRIGGRFFYDIADEASVSLHSVPRGTDDAWKPLAERELNTPFVLWPGPLFRVTYLVASKQAGACELILTAHHAIIDGVSAARLLHEVLDLCTSLTAGEEPGDPHSLNLLPAAEQLFPIGYRGIRGRLKQMIFAGRQMLAALQYWRKSTELDEVPIMPEGQCRIVTFQLPTRLTEQLAMTCRKQQVSLNSLLCAVHLLVARQHGFNGKTMRLRHFVFADLRPFLVPAVSAQCLGAYFAMLHMISALDEDEDPWTLARSLNRQIHTASNRGDGFNSVLMSEFLMKSVLSKPRLRMGHAALAFLGPVLLAKNYGGIRPSGLHAFVSNMVLGPVYTANVRIFMGQLCWDTIYLDCDMDHATASRLCREIHDTLATLATGGNTPVSKDNEDD